MTFPANLTTYCKRTFRINLIHFFTFVEENYFCIQKPPELFNYYFSHNVSSFSSEKLIAKVWYIFEETSRYSLYLFKVYLYLFKLINKEVMCTRRGSRSLMRNLAFCSKQSVNIKEGFSPASTSSIFYDQIS